MSLGRDSFIQLQLQLAQAKQFAENKQNEIKDLYAQLESLHKKNQDLYLKANLANAKANALKELIAEKDKRIAEQQADFHAKLQQYSRDYLNSPVCSYNASLLPPSQTPSTMPIVETAIGVAAEAGSSSSSSSSSHFFSLPAFPSEPNYSSDLTLLPQVSSDHASSSFSGFDSDGNMMDPPLVEFENSASEAMSDSPELPLPSLPSTLSSSSSSLGLLSNAEEAKMSDDSTKLTLSSSSSYVDSMLDEYTQNCFKQLCNLYKPPSSILPAMRLIMGGHVWRVNHLGSKKNSKEEKTATSLPSDPHLLKNGFHWTVVQESKNKNHFIAFFECSTKGMISIVKTKFTDQMRKTIMLPTQDDSKKSYSVAVPQATNPNHQSFKEYVEKSAAVQDQFMLNYLEPWGFSPDKWSKIKMGLIDQALRATNEANHFLPGDDQQIDLDQTRRRDKDNKKRKAKSVKKVPDQKSEDSSDQNPSKKRKLEHTPNNAMSQFLEVAPGYVNANSNLFFETMSAPPRRAAYQPEDREKMNLSVTP